MYDEALFYFLAIVSIMGGGVIIYKLLTRNDCYYMNDCIKKGHEIEYEMIDSEKHRCRCLTCYNYWFEFHFANYNSETESHKCNRCSFSIE